MRKRAGFTAEMALRDIPSRLRSKGEVRLLDGQSVYDTGEWVACEATLNGNAKIRCSMVAGDGHGPAHKRITRTGRVTHTWPAMSSIQKVIEAAKGVRSHWNRDGLGKAMQSLFDALDALEPSSEEPK